MGWERPKKSAVEEEMKILPVSMNRNFTLKGFKKVLVASFFTLGLYLAPCDAEAAGILTVNGSPGAPIQIKDHHLNLVIDNGFAQVEAVQTFFNPNGQDLEAVYSFPVPESASLSEFTIYAGEKEINGEVVERNKANEVYENERQQGNDAGVADKNNYQNFEFKVAKIPANAQTRIRFLYYQPLKLDTGVGRFVYPLEEGGTDEVAKSFWTVNSRVENSFSADVRLRIAYPVDEVRLPGFEQAAKIDRLGEGEYHITLDTTGVSLNRDLVVYYRLAQNLPGRLELLPCRPDKDKPGTFMAVLTPGIDLKPVAQGADYTFVLDRSGSMMDKIATLADGVERAIGELRPQDRFRIVEFNHEARMFTPGWIAATPESVREWSGKLASLTADGSTNLYDAMSMGMKDLNPDRVSSVILVTDGVTNTGVLGPQEFAKLMKSVDVRVFGFLMGNSSNWPLMRIISEESGGFYSSVSNSDDIMGRLLLAKSKITSEALHDAKLTVSGVKVFDGTDKKIGKIYRGQQLVLFGRYEKSGSATVSLKAKLSGEDKIYTTTFDFPETAAAYPEIERLWAMNRIEQIEHAQKLGLAEDEASESIKSLGLAYQLVTDETSMLVLSDESFQKYGISRDNKQRISVEHQAQSARLSAPVQSVRVDSAAPMFTSSAGHILDGVGGSGGGAIDPVTAILLLFGAGTTAIRIRRNKH